MPEKKPKLKKPASRTAPLTLSTPWAAALLALLMVLFFHELVFEGKTFVSPDASAPAGFVRVGEQALYHEHSYPLWNPYVFLGMPSFASGAYNPLIYPPDWPLALLQKVLPLPDMTWLLLYYFLAGFFTFLLAREWGATPEGALLAGAAFVFAPNLVAVGSHGHGSQLVGSAYLPLLLWLAARWMRRGGIAHLGWLALAGGFQMLRGHAQIAFYTWLALGLYVGIDLFGSLVRPGTASAPPAAKLVRALGVGAAMALAFGLAGFYNLPLRDYARWSIRGGGEGGGVGMAYATQWSLAPRELMTVVVPGAVGFGGATYWGAMPFTDYPNAFVGMAVAVVALPALLGADAPRVFAATLAAVALAISFGKHFPLYGFLYRHLPLFNKFRVPVMIILLFQLAAALAGGWGWSRVLTERGPEKRSPATGRVLLAASAALGLIFLIGVVGQDAWREGYARSVMAHREGFPHEAALLVYQRYVSDLARACLIGLAAVGLAWLARAGRLSAALASLSLLALLLVELWPVSGEVMKPVIGERVAAGAAGGRDDVIDFLEKAGPPGSFRVVPSPFDGPEEFHADFQDNRWAGFRIASLGGYHAAKPQLMQDLLERGGQTSPVWWRLLNVRYVIARHPIEHPPDFLKAIYRGSETVYENLAALPRVTVVGAYQVARPDTALLDSIAAFRHDPASFTFLDADPEPRPGSVADARASIVSYRLNDVTVDVDLPAPGIVRLADLWYPDWTVRVDGKDARLLRADYLLRAVAVGAGHHRLVFRFESRAVRQGLQISIGSLAVILVLLAAGWLRRRPAGSTAAPEAT